MCLSNQQLSCDRRTGVLVVSWAAVVIALGVWELWMTERTSTFSLQLGLWLLATAGAAAMVRSLLRRVRELRQMEAWMSTQRDLAAALGATSHLDVALTHCLGMALQVSGFDAGGVYVAETAGGLRLGVHQGFSAEFVRKVSHFGPGSALAQLVTTGRPWYSLYTQLPLPASDDRESTAMRAVAIVPIEHLGQIVACLMVASHRLDEVPLSTRRKLEDIASRVGAVISRIQTEEQSRVKDKQLRMLTKAVEQSSSTIVITNRKGDIEYANPQFAVTTGYSVAEALGRNPRLINSGDQTPEFYADMWKTISSGRNWHGEFHNRRKDGTKYWESATISPIFGPHDDITHFVAIKDDVTQQKIAMEELQSYAEALQAANARLAELNRMAERAVLAKGEFLANMSHEIRTPMTAILGYADLLADSVTQPEQRESVQVIRRNGDHLLAIINDILDLSKIEAGKLAIEPVECSPVSVLVDVISLMRVRAKAKGLSLNLEYEGDIPQTVRTDPTRLRQILINLVGNAVKFTQTGGVRLVVSLEDPQNLVPRLRCDIIDTGIGIDPQHFAELFQPFHQVDNSHSRSFGGTGLGLAISKRLAQVLGGDIVVHSRPGAGSTFSLRIAVGSLKHVPLIRPSSEVVADPVAPAQGDPVPLRGCRILLAEDGPDNQRLVSFLLRRAGAEVDIAENGRQAVEMALATFPGWGQRYSDPRTPYDLVLMDMQMPIMDGYAATRRLRREGYTRPILALTAHAMKGDREKCLAAGCTAYLTKPIDHAALVQAILEHIRPQPAAPFAEMPCPVSADATFAHSVPATSELPP